MKDFQKLFLSLSFLLLAACGSQQPETLESKRAELKKKKSELVLINQEIKTLEADILAMDPAAAKAVSRIPVGVESLSPKEFKHFIEVQGQVEADKNVMVSPKTAGALNNILVKEGQYVKRNQVLAIIDDALIKSQIEELNTQIELAKILYQKQKNLWDQEIGTEVQYLTSKNQYESLKSKLATLNEQKQMARIKSPISGTVDAIMPKIGEAVAPGQPAFRIVNTSDLSLKAEVSEAYIPYIKKGDIVDIDFPTIDKEIKARISSVGQFIHPNDRTFTVEVRLPNNSLFKANMFGDLKINDRTVKDAIVVPLNVIQRSEEEEFVFILGKNENGETIAKRKVVETGLSDTGNIEIKNGLNAGEELITAGFNNLSEGQILEVK